MNSTNWTPTTVNTTNYSNVLSLNGKIMDDTVVIMDDATYTMDDASNILGGQSTNWVNS